MADIEPLTGEPLALDLINTRPLIAGEPTDLLATPADLRGWLDAQADRQPGLTVAETAALTTADLVRVHEIRAHAAAALAQVREGERPPAAAVRVLNHAQLVAPAIRHLAWEGEALTVTRRRSGTRAARLAGWLAEAAVDLLADPAVRGVRECEAEDCVLLFLPAHPRRRWCSAARCGNRARVARYYQRHKST